MKLFITICITWVVFTNAKPVPTADVNVTANPTLAAAIQAVKDFLSEANILKIVQIFAASSPDAQSVLDALQGVEDQGIQCVFQNIGNNSSQNVNQTIIETLLETANNECSEYGSELNNLVSALKSANLTSIVSGFNLTALMPASLGEIYQDALTADVQLYQEGPTEANLQAVNDANIKLLTALLDADDETNAALLAEQPFSAEIILPNGTYYPVYRTYLQQSVYALAKNSSFNVTTFIDASLKLNEFYIQVLPEALSWTQNELDKVVIPADIVADANLVQGAQRLYALTSKIDDLVTDPDFINTLNQISTGTFVLPSILPDITVVDITRGQ